MKTDAQIQTEVMQELKWDPSVTHEHIGVSVFDGVVTLSGSHERDDQEIAKTILNHFKWNIQIPENLVKSSVENGWVVLSGEVDWAFQKTAAENTVKALTGVIGVLNNIKIKSKKVQPEVIKQKIEEALKREAEREAKRIQVEVQGSKVILSGNVHSFSELNDAKWAALSAPGVTSIENNLHVDS